MATSYANPGGTGNRTATITVTITGGFVSGSPSTLVNGNTTETVLWFTGVSAITFQFSVTKIIDEAKFYQSNATAHGLWQWQGGLDGSTWADIGGTFTLGGSTLQTQTTLAGNTSGYTFYRLVPAGGSFSSSPWVQEFEFKIEDGAPPVGTASRLTQLVAETLILPAPPPARATQLLVETLSSLGPTAPPAHLTQLIAETLSFLAPTAPPAALTQLVAELLIAPTGTPLTQFLVEVLTQTPPPAQLTQLVADLLTLQFPPSTARVSQLPVEVAHQYAAPPARVSQLPVEAVIQYVATVLPARVSQSPLEIIHQYTPSILPARVSQGALEIIYPFGCYVPISPPPLCPTDFPIDPVTPGGSCPTPFFDPDSEETWT